MKNFLLCVFFLVGMAIHAQHDLAFVTGLTKEVNDKLKAKGIDTYFNYKKYCAGEIQIFQIRGKTCVTTDTYYEVFVVWNENGVDYMQKIDNCGLYRQVKLSNTMLSDFYTKEYASLKDDVVKPYRSETYTGKPELRKEVEPCFHGIEFNKGTQNFDKEFNLFDISNNSDGANKNYDFNQNLKLIELYYMLDGVVIFNEFIRQ